MKWRNAKEITSPASDIWVGRLYEGGTILSIMACQCGALLYAKIVIQRDSKICIKEITYSGNYAIVWSVNEVPNAAGI